MPEEIGPIRFVRPMDPAIISPLGGLLAFSGGQQGVLDLVAESNAQPLSHDEHSDGFYRVKWRRAPHNVYGSLERFLAQGDNEHLAAPSEHFGFAHGEDEPTAVADGASVDTLTFELSSASKPSWRWDADAKGWLRSDGQCPRLDNGE